ncbi:PPK2 family polyphosphate kinase [Lactobacillus intestinalis]|uniref:PPK2 family polyphosphate kinase n=1 Tax=Lactobacillus intestinalis TaxID=151781 RepID=UPI0026EA280D|nr:PPK2 family polyphosphate kinase [Lactobacillus intestinalis]
MDTEQFCYTKNNFEISNTPTFVKDSSKDLKHIKRQIKHNVKHLKQAQSKMFARHEYSILIVLQGMDASGKDSMIKHILSGVSPSGCNVVSFKQPTEEEKLHDYMWRVNRKLPPRGHIGVFNRSYYEDVVVTRVHPQIILNDYLPNIHSLADINEQFFENRYTNIRNYEDYLTQNGYVILKFFLHISKAEQKKRFLARINTSRKNWKLSASDIKERQYWNKYQAVYQRAINATATNENPWYVIPSDDKWYSRLIVSNILTKRINEMPLAYPTLTAMQKKDLVLAKQFLEDEDKY